MVEALRVRDPAGSWKIPTFLKIKEGWGGGISARQANYEKAIIIILIIMALTAGVRASLTVFTGL